jgi:hypothetical protein
MFMETIKQWAAVVIVDHGGDERGEFRTVATASTVDEAMRLAGAACKSAGPQYIGFTAQPIR